MYRSFAAQKKWIITSFFRHRLWTGSEVATLSLFPMLYTRALLEVGVVYGYKINAVSGPEGIVPACDRKCAIMCFTVGTTLNYLCSRRLLLMLYMQCYRPV